MLPGIPALVARRALGSRRQRGGTRSDLPDAGVDAVLLNRLGDADGHRPHVLSWQGAVSVQAPEGDGERASQDNANEPVTRVPL